MQSTEAGLLPQTEKKTQKKTEAGLGSECENCKNPHLEELANIIQKPLNIKTCHLLSCKEGAKGASCKHLMEGKLSDYWAQRMLIGSDLLREELKKTSPPGIENWIAVFDSQEYGHNTAVKNLISDEGPHAVLPNLGEKNIPTLLVNEGSQHVKNYKDYIDGKGYKPALSLYETSGPWDSLFVLHKDHLIISTSLNCSKAAKRFIVYLKSFPLLKSLNLSLWQVQEMVFQTD
ncbi:MAG: hypothetical protein OXH36_03355 [Bdellovibrionales bacterium]|nr:hypothetical protein [Bdellovibrionales bacterium]